MKKKGILFLILGLFIFGLGRWSQQRRPLEVVRYDTLSPMVRVDTVRDTLLVPKYVEVMRFDTIRDTIEGQPIYWPLPVRSYLFTDDSTYRVEMEGYQVQARKIEVYPRTITRTIIERIERPVSSSRWGVGPQVGFGYNGRSWTPYVGVGIQYNLVRF